MAIRVRAEKNLVRDYKERVIGAESLIQQLADQILLRVTEARFNSEVGGLQTSIGELVVRSDGILARIDNATHSLTAEGYTFRDSTGKEMVSLSKGMASQGNFPLEGNVESGFPIRGRLYFDSSTNSIEQVMLRWQNYPFRTDSKGAAAGGGQTSGPSSTSTTGAGGSSTPTSAAGGGGTSGPSSRSTSYTWSSPFANTTWQRYAYDPGDPNAHYHDIPSTTFSHYHDISHTHSVYAHTHTVAIPEHSHGMAHTHVVTDHVHGVIFGILEQAVTSNAIDIVIDGVLRASVNASYGEVDLSPYLTTNGWHSVELRSTTLKRIEATLYYKSYIRR